MYRVLMVLLDPKVSKVLLVLKVLRVLLDL